jgi:LysM repeat protein
MRSFIFTILLGCQLATTTFAQKAIDGKWHIKTDNQLDGVLSASQFSDCTVKLTTAEPGLIMGEYLDCLRKTTVEAQLFNNEIITFLIQDPDGIIVCTGRWDGKNEIKGTYYQQGVGKEGDFAFQRIEPKAEVAAKKKAPAEAAKKAAPAPVATLAAAPSPAALSPAALSPTAAVQAATHIVKQGDTFYSIARKYGLTFQQLLDLNNKKDAAIKVGEVLRVAP